MKLFGPYRVIRELGRGGMGAVYEVEDPRLPGRRLALKQSLSDEPTTTARFLREAELLARVQHPNVVRIIALDHSPSGPYLVTELVEGEELHERARGRTCDPQEAARLVREIAGAVAAVHAQGVLHRDLKPQNVIVRADGSPVLLDFGVARELGGERLTQTGAILGSVQYMPPEQAGGDSPDSLTPATDVYALGAILFFLLSGGPPFHGETFAVVTQILTRDPLWPDAPAGLLATLRKAMAKAPADRYPTAEALQADLDRFLSGRAVDAEPPPRSRRGALAGAALLLVALAAGLALRQGAAPSPPAPAAAGPEAVEALTAATAAPRPTPTATSPPVAPERDVRLLKPPRLPAETLNLNACFLTDSQALVWSAPPLSLDRAEEVKQPGRLWRVDLSVSPARWTTRSIPGGRPYVSAAVPGGNGDAYLAIGPRIYHLTGDGPQRPIGPPIPGAIRALARAPNGLLGIGLGAKGTVEQQGRRAPVAEAQPLYTLDPRSDPPVLTPRSLPGAGARFPVRSVAVWDDGRLLAGTATLTISAMGPSGSVYDVSPGGSSRRTAGVGDILCLEPAAHAPALAYVGTTSAQVFLLRDGALVDPLPFAADAADARRPYDLSRSIHGSVRGLVSIGAEVLAVSGDSKPGTNDLRRWRWNGTAFEHVGGITRFGVYLSSLAASPDGRRVILGTARSARSQDRAWIEVWPVARVRGLQPRDAFRKQERP